MVNSDPIKDLNQKKPLTRAHQPGAVVCNPLARVFNGHKRVHPQERTKNEKSKPHRQADAGRKPNGVVAHTLAVGKGRGVRKSPLDPAIKKLQAGVVHPVHMGLPDLVALAVAAPRPVHGLENLDRKKTQRCAKDVHEDAGRAPEVVVGHKIVDAERVAKDGVQAEQAQETRVRPCASMGEWNKKGGRSRSWMRAYSGDAREFSSAFF